MTLECCDGKIVIVTENDEPVSCSDVTPSQSGGQTTAPPTQTTTITTTTTTITTTTTTTTETTTALPVGATTADPLNVIKAAESDIDQAIANYEKATANEVAATNYVDLIDDVNAFLSSQRAKREIPETCTQFSNAFRIYINVLKGISDDYVERDTLIQYETPVRKGLEKVKSGYICSASEKNYLRSATYSDSSSAKAKVAAYNAEQEAKKKAALLKIEQAMATIESANTVLISQGRTTVALPTIQIDIFTTIPAGQTTKYQA